MKKTNLAMLVALLMLLTLPMAALGSPPPSTTFTFSSSTDFAQGTLQGLNCTVIPDQLQLNKNTLVHSFIWIANAAEGTVSKLDTTTGREVARYRTGPANNTNPSRTSVDNDGNCWVGNRGTGTVLKIAGVPTDLNGNGTIDTSRDLDNNGVISGSEILPWGQDEAILANTLCGNNVNSLPRSLAIDSNGFIWVGLYNMSKYIVLNPNGSPTGREVAVPNPPGTYGAAIDSAGFLYSSNLSGNRIDKINTNTDTLVTSYPVGDVTYGIVVDREGNVWSPIYNNPARLCKVNGATGQIQFFPTNGSYGRGVAVDGDGNVWAAFSGNNIVQKFSPSGAILLTVNIGAQGGSGPIGVAVDSQGYIWVVNQGSSNAIKMDTSGTIIGKYPTGQGPYSYSDMTGYNLENLTTHEGTWNVVQDGGVDGALVKKISWHQQLPAGTSISVKARAAASVVDLAGAAFVDVVNEGAIDNLAGRYIELEVKLATDDLESPVLEDISLEVASPDTTPPTAEIQYSTTAPTNQDVTVHLVNPSEPITITNNGGSDTYVFNSNGSFTFEFQDAAGNTATATSVVDWIDKVAPTAEIEYSTTSPTNQDVTVRLVNPSEPITIINNGGSDTYVFSDNGSFVFEIRDAVGNTADVTAAVTCIDKVAPTASIIYDVTDPTSGAVTAMLTNSSEPITITNNGGSSSYVFNENGSFTFEFQDVVGNTGTVTATVDWILNMGGTVTINAGLFDLGSDAKLANLDLLVGLHGRHPITPGGAGYVLYKSESTAGEKQKVWGPNLLPVISGGLTSFGMSDFTTGVYQAVLECPAAGDSSINGQPVSRILIYLNWTNGLGSAPIASIKFFDAGNNIILAQEGLIKQGIVTATQVNVNW